MKFRVQVSNRSMSSKVSLAQFCASEDIEKNLSVIQSLIFKAKEQGSKLIAFPEASDFISFNFKRSLHLVNNTKTDFLRQVQEFAKGNQIWVAIGSHEKSKDFPEKLYNTYYVINGLGEVVGKYRKIHLFDVDLGGKVRLVESSKTLPGTKVEELVDTPLGKLGLAICYDIRFPELSLSLRLKGAQILIYPSVFTVPTGQAHWETLVRARAIETQTYVLAPAQVGKHNFKRESYGHSMIVDPWGKVLVDGGEKEEAIVTAEIDLNYLEKVRNQMPTLEHRKPELYLNLKQKL